MRVAVAGGTGMIGRHLVSALKRSGNEPVVLARSRGVDITTGSGLDEALAGSDVVIDVSNVSTLSKKRSVQFFTAATQHLLAAGARAGVKHHVALSIVGIDRVGAGYYQGKLAQEQLIAAGGLPWTVLRATQFHEFAGQLLQRSPGPLVVVPRMPVQTVAAREVADQLVALATGPAVGGFAPEIAGPEVHELADLVRQVLRRREQRRPVVRVPIPGGGSAARGGLLPAGEYTAGTQTFAEWLQSEGSTTGPASR
jgi:uncharacterized protein YbjT (DUF2867 family)